MNEAAARQVLLVQAFDTARPRSASWSEDDSAWATRVALQDVAAKAESNDGVLGGERGGEGFVAARAAHALQRLGTREPAAMRWMARSLWRPAWLLVAVLVGGVAGLLADSIGSSQRINLLAPPLWAVLVWNAVVYALLTGHAAAAFVRTPRRAGWFLRATEALMRLGRARPAGANAVLRSFIERWWRLTAGLSAARAATLLHAASAALALGLIGGLYVRGLVLDYRAAWESTFLSAETAHAALALLLAPAVAVSGIALPDATAFEALRAAHGSNAPGASAAPWIHLFALTLLMFVVLPRMALALGSGLRSAWLARRINVPWAEPYFQQLLRQRSGHAARIIVRPYAATPVAQAALALARVFGETAALQIAPTVAFGGEDDAEAGDAASMSSASVIAALFDLSATPEAENQGRFVQRLTEHAGGAAVIVLVDEAAFVRRFGTTGSRREQRRDAWRRWAEALGTVPVFADLATPDSAMPDIAATERDLQRALTAPARHIA